jgi:hypothetical protein
MAFLACWYSIFLSGATSDKYSALNWRTCLEICSDSALLPATAAFFASSLISLVNSAFDLLDFPADGM